MSVVKASRRTLLWKSLGWLLAGLVFYLVALVMVAPAQKIYALTSQQLAPLQLQNVDGTLWKGQARNGDYNGVSLERLNWQFAPLKLLVGKLGYSLNGQVAGARLDGRVATRTGKQIEISDAIVTTTLAQLLEELNAPPQVGSLNGQVTVQGDSIVLKNQQLKTLRGEAVVASLRHAGLKNVDLGDFKLQSDTVDEVTTITAKDLRGVLAMDLVFTVDSEQKFSAKGTLKPRADAPRELAGLLLLFGRRQPDGSFVVDRSGQLPSA